MFCGKRERRKERRSRINKFVQRTYPQVVQLFCIKHKRGNIFDWIWDLGLCFFCVFCVKEFGFWVFGEIPNERSHQAVSATQTGDQPRKRRYTFETVCALWLMVSHETSEFIIRYWI